MKQKTINIILCKKFDAWLNSIEDKTVKNLAKNNTTITGGCIASMLLGEKINDFDLYFKDFATTKAVTEYYVEKFKKNPPNKFKGSGDAVKIYVEASTEAQRVKIIIKSQGIASEAGTEAYEYFESDEENPNAASFVAEVMSSEKPKTEEGEPYRPVFLSSNAITLSDRIQIICRFFGDPEKIHENYDYVHCTNYWSSWDRKLHLNEKALASLLTKELKYVGSKYPLCSVIRSRKFINRGWTINAGQYLKMLMQLNSMNLSDVNILEDQLTGVDVAYFTEVIHKLREKDSEVVDAAYLMEIINRMF